MYPQVEFHCRKSRRHRRGLSQVEVVVSTLIVGVIIVGALKVVGGATRTNRVASEQLVDPGLAYQLMGEILTLPYEDPEEPGGPLGLETGETNTTRADFDDVDDYHTWDVSPPEAKDGATIPNATGWQQKVNIEYFDPSTGQKVATETGVKRIKVKIVSPDGAEFRIQALRSRWGVLEQPAAKDTTVVNSLDGQLQMGSSAAAVLSATPLQNHANE